VPPQAFDDALTAEKNSSEGAKEALGMLGKRYHVEATVEKQLPLERSTWFRETCH
jgi:hypothetical protein